MRGAHPTGSSFVQSRAEQLLMLGALTNIVPSPGCFDARVCDAPAPYPLLYLSFLDIVDTLLSAQAGPETFRKNSPNLWILHFLSVVLNYCLLARLGAIVSHSK